MVALNRAAAVAMRDGPAEGLRAIAEIAATGALDSHPLLHSSHADLLRRLSRIDDAVNAYRQALTLTTNDAERRFLERRLAQCDSRTP